MCPQMFPFWNIKVLKKMFIFGFLLSSKRLGGGLKLLTNCVWIHFVLEIYVFQHKTIFQKKNRMQLELFYYRGHYSQSKIITYLILFLLTFGVE